MAIDDIYVIDYRESFNGEDIHNTFTYEALGEHTAFELGVAFGDAIVTDRLLPVQCSQIKAEGLKVYNLGNPGDLFEWVYTNEGGLDEEMLPLFNAVGYTLKSSKRGIRPGSKRFAGVPESVQVDGVITDAGYITALNSLRTALADELDDGEGNFYRPVIVKRVKYVVPDSDPVRYAYRFPETDLELDTATILAVLLNRDVTSQTSRKR